MSQDNVEVPRLPPVLHPMILSGIIHCLLQDWLVIVTCHDQSTEIIEYLEYHTLFPSQVFRVDE